MSSPSEQALLEKLREATLALRAVRTERDALARAQKVSEPLAIVGMGCRFPGADEPDAYWELLTEGRDAIRSLKERWAFTGQRPVKDAPAWAGLLSDIDAFDPAFFGISPREARVLDPQQRLLLEVSWEALEHAGLSPEALPRSKTAVFVGASGCEYAQLVSRQPLEERDVFSMTGTLLSTAAGRLSYTLGLSGPSMTVDTACSSSLVAVHLAARSLRQGECDLALAAGVNVILGPDVMSGLTRSQTLSADGRCRTFDAGANGFVRGEGCGVVVLKRLSDAQRDGDFIWAVIRGSAVNQDGRSSSLTAPNALAQQALLTDALTDARVSADSIGYVEAHGTATSIGDPIEVEALKAVLGEPRADGSSSCVLGAVKTNVGHLEAAAGVAGLMKAALALHYGAIPRNLHFRSLNPRLSLSGTPFVIPTQTVSWPRGAKARFAGVSAFGISGTNAHVILEESPPRAAKSAGENAPQRTELIVLSAKTSEALEAGKARLRTHVARAPTLPLADIAATLALGRVHHAHRFAALVSSTAELAEVLGALEQPSTGRGLESALGAIQRHYLAGGNVEWPAVIAKDARRVPLPSYAWQRQRYWCEKYLLREPALPAPAPLAFPTIATTESNAEPIAIIGIGCRYPGDIHDPESFWQLLERGGDAVAEVPEDRWNAQAYYDPNPDAFGKSISSQGAFLKDVQKFDAAFFGISPKEAKKLDPQQRLLLETTWEALDRAGIAAKRLTGTDTGVFVGVMSNDYKNLIPIEDWDGYVGTGTAYSLASGRISYLLGAHGPSLTVDTACSSSLVTLHLACQALRQGECSVALAGGVSLTLTPHLFVEFSRLRGMAPDGRCKSFSAAADGVGWSEGCGMLVLKRLSDAQRDGDNVLALIHASAVNQDGPSNGLTSPNWRAQAALVAKAVAQAGLTPADVDYVECHGTGTALGDPIEVQALGAALSEGRTQPLIIGSVKTNLGHAQAAAGVAGVIKTVLALQNERIPRNLHFDAPSPDIPWNELKVQVAAKEMPWRSGDKPRYAGVSSFGIGGTNAHLVIGEAPVSPQAPRTGVAEEKARPELIVWSARREESLEVMAAHLAAALESQPHLTVKELGRELASTRSHHEHRLALVAESREGLAQTLSAIARSELPPGVRRRRVLAQAPRMVFVFPGQGSQWVGMGRELLESEPAFRASVEKSDAAIQEEAGFSVLAELLAGEKESQLGRIEVVQPVLFAMQVALSELWKSYGVVPDAVVGHSMGEVAAAHVAGALTLKEAVAVICRRSRLMRRLSGKGEMAVVELSRQEAQAALRGLEDKLSVAVCNSPRSSVVSGEPEALERVLKEQEAKGVYCRRVKVDVASHSPQVEELREELLEALGDLSPKAPKVAMVSTVTQLAVEKGELDAQYWLSNLRQPVLFGDVVQQLLASGAVCFIEVSPHPVLTTAMEDACSSPGSTGGVVGSLRRNLPERSAFLESLGAVFVHGAPLDAARVFPGTGNGRPVVLPAYPWSREEHWLDVPVSGAFSASESAGTHPLLGAPFEVADLPGKKLWVSRISSRAQPWFLDHRVGDAVVFPGAGYVEIGLASGCEVFGDAPFELADVEFERMLVIPDAAPVPLQVSLTASASASPESAGMVLQVSSRADGVWQGNMRGVMRRAASSGRGTETTSLQDSLKELRAACSRAVSAEALYARMSERGLNYGPTFQGVTQAWLGEGQVLARVELSSQLAKGQYRAHPALLDACFQAVALLDPGTGTNPAVPVSIGCVSVLAPERRVPGRLWVHARLRSETSGAPGFSADLTLLSDDGAPVGHVTALRAQEISLSSLTNRESISELLFQPSWTALPPVTGARTLGQGARTPEAPAPAPWLILADGAGVGQSLATQLREQGERCIVVAAGHQFSPRAPDEWTCDPSSRESFTSLLEAAFPSASRACAGVVHLWPVDGRPGAGDSRVAVEEDLRLGTHSALHLTQALLRHGFRDPPKLWLVTRHAQSLEGDVGSVSVSQAALWGLGRVIAIEHPELSCTRVDLEAVPGAPAAGAANALLRELLAEDGEDQVVLRGARRLGARLLPLPATPPLPEVLVVADATYLITGGLGGLGLSVAEWLVAQGARNLMLVGRGAPSDAALSALERMTTAGARVLPVRADVSELSDMERVFGELSALLPPLRGVIHAAGVLDDATLENQDAQKFETVMRPKVHGAWALHTLTAGRDLDFFVLYSSAAGLLGSPGQANYAAANTYLDGLAQLRESQGLPALSVNWGAFGDVGLAAAQANRGERLAFRGIASLSADEGVQALRRLLRHRVAQAAAVRLDVQRWIEFYPAAAASPFLRELRRMSASRAEDKTEARRARKEIEAAAVSERPALMERYVRSVLGVTLRLAPEAIDRHAIFRTLGLDSLMSLEVRNRLDAGLGTRTSAALLFMYPSLAELSAHLLERLSMGPGLGPVPPAAPPAATVVSAIEAEVDGEVEAMTEEELAKLITSRFDEAI